MNNSVSAAPAGAKGKDCTPNPTPFPKQTPAAMAYIPFQQFEQIYPPEKALDYGTVFPELNKPFLGGGAGK